MKHLVIIDGASDGGFESKVCELQDEEELQKFYRGYELVKNICNEHSEEIERLDCFIDEFIEEGNINEEDSKLLEWFNDNCIPYGHDIDIINIYATIYTNITYDKIVKLQ